MINTKSKAEGKTKRQIAQEEKVSFWQNHIQGWRERGINRADYCREHGLKETAFTYWKGKLRQARSAVSGTSGASGTSPISLVPVEMKVNLEPSPKSILPKPIVAKPLVVVVDGHYRIEVSGDFDSATMGKLVSTLRQL
jgi:hypothetical protein